MDRKTRTSLERLKLVVDSERPSEQDRERVADQLLTREQLRRIEPTLEKLSQAPAHPSKKLPPTANGEPANKLGRSKSKQAKRKNSSWLQ